MKFLLDVCAASHSMQTVLTNLGHDVLSATETMREGNMIVVTRSRVRIRRGEHEET